MSSRSCPQCGARLADGAERCDLCGSPVAAGEEASEADEGPEPGPGDIPEPQTSSEDGTFCNACGWKNPVGSNFCSRCGAALQQVDDPSGLAPSAAMSTPAGSRPVDAGEIAEAGEAPARDDDEEENGSITRHVALLIGLSVLVVTALYMVTVVSKQRTETSNAETAVTAPADVRSAAVIDQYESIPIGERFAPTADSLRAAIDRNEGAEAFEARRALVDFMIEIGRIDRAAIEQQRLARASDGVEDWRRAGNLLFDWMETVNNERKTDVALLTIEAFENVLSVEPGDLDVRADLGWAYQYDQQNPMKAIENTNRVLEEDPDHLVANYNRGVFLLRINRVDEAVEQFERVVALAESGSPYERQAQAWIRTIEAEASESS